MTRVNLAEAKTDLLYLVQLLESHQEDVIILSRNGIPVVEMKLTDLHPNGKRIGVAKGKLEIPDEFDRWDQEIESLFGDEI